MGILLNLEAKILSKIKDGSIDKIIAASRNKDAVMMLDDYIVNGTFSALISKIKTDIDEDGFFDWLPVFIAMVRYAGEKILNISMFDVQVLGGLTIFSGNVAEMATGEGKTFTAVLPVFLNCICGRSNHIVTVNDYLAKRDCEWMRLVYDILGIKAGYIQYDMNAEEKKKVYISDVVYGSNNEFGFDYLRDNMVHEVNEVVQNDLDAVIIDEIDSVLIDEARVPLVISGMSHEKAMIFTHINALVSEFLGIIKGQQNEYIFVDLAANKVEVKEKGWNLFFYKYKNTIKLENESITKQIIKTCLRANLLFKKDCQYIVQDGRIIIVDEFTGRQMPGRRYKAGLHQALEAKEGLTIEGESQILATITFQKYFMKYKKISGMTGTAKTEENELGDLYGLKVYQIPSNKPCIRCDKGDRLYLDEKSKYGAIVNFIKFYHDRGNPILVGTRLVEKSELLSVMLNYNGIKHCVLNAKNHEQEAEIIKKAGLFGNITVATNMAGRGTDIILDKESLESGGLVVVGTEKHDAQRIDNQLRGRSSRQGEPGTSIFFVSLEDEIFYNRDIDMFKDLANDKKEIDSELVAPFMDGVQKDIENKNSNIRKIIYEFDKIFSKHRDFAYEKRRNIFDKKNVGNFIAKIISDVVEVNWDTPNIFPKVEIKTNDKKEIKELIGDFINKKIKSMSKKDFYDMVKTLYLIIFDKYWNRFLNFVDIFMLEVKGESGALGLFDMECEKAFVKTWYLIERNFLILLLFNDKIGDIVFDEAKINL